jgi:hypothetical protein
MAYYKPPDWFNRNVFNPVVAALTRAGLSVAGSRILRVRGRTSGSWRSAPVNLLTYEGARYLVAPRGQTQWARNLRVAGGGELLLGAKVEPFRAVELSDGEKVPILRAYLKKWKFEVGMFFRGVDASSTDDTITRIAPDHPVFRIE